MGKVIVVMEQYIIGVLDVAPSDMNRVANTPASVHLFQVNPLAQRLCAAVCGTVSPLGGYVTVFVQKRLTMTSLQW